MGLESTMGLLRRTVAAATPETTDNRQKQNDRQLEKKMLPAPHAVRAGNAPGALRFMSKASLPASGVGRRVSGVKTLNNRGVK